VVYFGIVQFLAAVMADNGCSWVVPDPALGGLRPQNPKTWLQIFSVAKNSRYPFFYFYQLDTSGKITVVLFWDCQISSSRYDP
jgi:hypothetical protein